MEETRGRPSVLNDEMRRKIDEAAALGASIEEIAYYCGVHRSTLYQWMKDSQDLSDRITELQEKPILKARQTIITSLSDPNGARWYLEKKRKKEFGNAVDITTGGDKIGEPSVRIKELALLLKQLHEKGKQDEPRITTENVSSEKRKETND